MARRKVPSSEFGGDDGKVAESRRSRVRAPGMPLNSPPFDHPADQLTSIYQTGDPTGQSDPDHGWAWRGDDRDKALAKAEGLKALGVIEDAEGSVEERDPKP